MTHMYLGKLTILSSDNGLSPERRQAIIWTNTWILLIGPLGTNFSEILIGIQTFSSKESIWKIRLWNGVHFVSASLCHYTKVFRSFSYLNKLHTKIVNLLVPSDATWFHKTWSTLVDCQNTRWLDSQWLTLPMMTSSNGNGFHVTGPLWGESSGRQWVPLTTGQ